MAKKKKVEVEEPQIEKVTITEKNYKDYVKDVLTEDRPKVERLKPKNEWEIKDRVYFLKGNNKPISRMIKSADIYYFDQEKGFQREMKYCQNQQTCFVDEMKGDQRLSHIIFRNGTLFVPKGTRFTLL